MPTFDEYRVLPVADRLSRLRQTPGELDEAISDRDGAELGRRHGAGNWSAKEILCHLRAVEELFQVRLLTLGEWVASLAGHDDNHLDQFDRALAGLP